MDKVIIFTNYDSLKKLADANGKSMNLNNLSVLQGNKFTGFDEVSQTFHSIETFIEVDLILINDAVDRYEYDAFMCEIEPSSCTVLKHREPHFSDFLEYKICYIGMHEPDGKFYPLVHEILSDSKPLKRERLLNTVFHVDTVLANKILLFQAILNESIPDYLEYKLVKYKTAIDSFRPFLKSDILAPEYIDAFEQLYSSIMLN